MKNRVISLLTVASMAFGFAIPLTHAAVGISGDHVWDFAEYAAEPLIADGAISEDYNGHIITVSQAQYSQFLI